MLCSWHSNLLCNAKQQAASISSSICLLNHTLRKEIKTDRKGEKWSDTPSHEKNLQLHLSTGNEWTPVGNSLNGLICNWFSALITGLVTPVSWLILCRSDEAGRLVCVGTVRVRQPLFNYAAHIGDEASLNPRVITSPRSLLSANVWKEGAVLGGSPTDPSSPWLAP